MIKTGNRRKKHAVDHVIDLYTMEWQCVIHQFQVKHAVNCINSLRTVKAILPIVDTHNSSVIKVTVFDFGD